MPLSLDDAIKHATPEEVRALILQLGAAAGFPSSAWQSFSTPRTMVELEAVSYADLAGLIGAIGASGFLDFASGPWLDLCVQGFYGVTRQPAVFTRGKLLLSDDAGGGPFTFDIEELTVSAGDELRFVNTEAGTLTASGTLSVAFRAESPGAAWNLPEGTPLELASSLPGVSVVTDTPPAGTWITQQGGDEEADDALRLRARSRWGELGYGATEAAYLYWALTASPEVTRVGLPNPLGDGVVYLYLAGTNGPASGAAAADVQAFLQPRLPQGVRASVSPAVVRTIAVTGTAVVKAAYKASAQAAGNAAIAKLMAKHAVGGVVYRSQIETSLMTCSPGMIDVQLPGLAATTVLLGGEVPVASVGGLTWSGA